MDENVETLPGWDDSLKPFIPISKYYWTMDLLLYLKEDVSYRADRVDRLLTLLWHPYDDELVGIQIKGFRCLCLEHPLLSEIAKDDNWFLPLALLVADLFMKDEAWSFIANPSKENIESLVKKYNLAMAFVAQENAKVFGAELKRAA